MQKTVVITMEGGVIQHVDRTEEITVVVRDYDIEGAKECQLQVDDAGNRFLETTWSGKTQVDQLADALLTNIRLS